jgi:hypothetical protein
VKLPAGLPPVTTLTAYASRAGGEWTVTAFLAVG